jgi:hypothetical protein
MTTATTSTSSASIPLVTSSTNGDVHNHNTPSATPVTLPTSSSTPVAATTVKANGESIPNLGEMDAKCGGCAKVIDQDSGGVVVAFG